MFAINVTGAFLCTQRALRPMGQVEDVAYCAVFLAAEAANYLTGQVLQPSGGWVMA